MGFFWFHLFSSLENTEDMTPYTLVELGLRSHVKLGRNLYHNYSSQRGREMKNASFFYLVSSEIMDINPVPRWMRGFLFFFFYCLHNFLAHNPLTCKSDLFIWGKMEAGQLQPYFIYLQSYDFNCSLFFFHS